MKIPLELSFLNMERSPELEHAVHNRAKKLDRFAKHIIACKTVVESPHKHHHKGNLYHVRIDISLPKHEIIINRSPSEHHAHEDPHVAIRDAFFAAGRQLEDLVSKEQDKDKQKSTESFRYNAI